MQLVSLPINGFAWAALINPKVNNTVKLTVRLTFLILDNDLTHFILLVLECEDISFLKKHNYTLEFHAISYIYIYIFTTLYKTPPPFRGIPGTFKTPHRKKP